MTAVRYVEDADTCEECGAPMLGADRCANGCHVYIPAEAHEDPTECLNCLRQLDGLPPLAPHEAPPRPLDPNDLHHALPNASPD